MVLPGNTARHRGARLARAESPGHDSGGLIPAVSALADTERRPAGAPDRARPDPEQPFRRNSDEDVPQRQQQDAERPRRSDRSDEKDRVDRRGS
jgi:hypothetical protein